MSSALSWMNVRDQQLDLLASVNSGLDVISTYRRVENQTQLSPASMDALESVLNRIQGLVTEKLDVINQRQIEPLNQVTPDILDDLTTTRQTIQSRLEEELEIIRNKEAPYSTQITSEIAHHILAHVEKENREPHVTRREIFWQEKAIQIEQKLLRKQEALKQDFETLLKEIKALTRKEDPKTGHSYFKRSPIVFISYAQPKTETRPHENWTQKFLSHFEKHLSMAGVLTSLDIRHSKNGRRTREFMGKIEDANHVLFIGTESLRDKTRGDAPQHMVKIEFKHIRDRLNKSVLNPALAQGGYDEPIVPILLSGSFETSFPPELLTFASMQSFIHFENPKNNYILQLKNLFEHFFQVGEGPGRQEWDKLWKKFKNQYPSIFKPMTIENVAEQWEKTMNRKTQKAIAIATSQKNAIDALNAREEEELRQLEDRLGQSDLSD